MRIDNAVHDRKSKASAFLARSEEWIEDALARLGGNARASVLDAENNKRAATAVSNA